MLIFRQMSGYANMNTPGEVLRYTNIWGVGTTKSPIYLLGNEFLVENLTAVCIGENGVDVEILCYPHNGKNFAEICTKLGNTLEKRIGDFLSKQDNGKLPKGVYIPVDINSMTRITPRCFYQVSYIHTNKYVAFSGEDGKISLLCLENLSADHKYLFPALLGASRYVSPPANTPTVTGKRFVYELYLREYSISNGGDPYLDSVLFPWNEHFLIPGTLKTSQLEKLAEGRQDEIIRTRKGVEESKSTQITMSTLETDIISSVLNKSSVLLSQLLEYGVDEFITLTNPKPTDILTVEIDISGVARKMAIFEGKLRIVPISLDFDVENFLGVKEDVVIIDDDATFPRRFAGTL